MKQFHSILWKEDKWFIAKALEVEVASQGRTEKEALKNLQEALHLYSARTALPSLKKSLKSSKKSQN